MYTITIYIHSVFYQPTRANQERHMCMCVPKFAFLCLLPLLLYSVHVHVCMFSVYCLSGFPSFLPICYTRVHISMYVYTYVGTFTLASCCQQHTHVQYYILRTTINIHCVYTCTCTWYLLYYLNCVHAHWTSGTRNDTCHERTQ